MGADGGTTAKRKELVKQAPGASKEDEHTAHEYNKLGLWKSCYLTSKPLREPVVSDYRGHMYVKEAVLELLVDPESYTEKQRQLVSHIKSLRDVVELKLTREDEHFICPITGNELGSGGIDYVYLVKCRCVFAEKCLKEISNGSMKCPLCNEPYETEDVITLNPGEEKMEKLEQRMSSLNERKLPHSLVSKKSKKKRKHDSSTDEAHTKKKSSKANN